MRSIPELRMLGEGSIGMGLELSLEVRKEVRRDGRRWARRGARGEVETLAVLGQQAFDGAATDPEGAGDLSLGHAALDGSHDAQAQINRISFHDVEYAIGSVSMLTAVEQRRLIGTRGQRATRESVSSRV
jgi:hypothetical protein